jgi:ATP-dependent Clp protease ATP-binding subunit ClpC
MAERFDRFNSRSKEVFIQASLAAERFNHHYIGTEHLLIGLMGDQQIEASLGLLGIKRLLIEEAVLNLIGWPEQKLVPNSGLTLQAKGVILGSVEVANQRQHELIRPDDLLASMVNGQENNGTYILHRVIHSVADQGSLSE